MIKFNHVYNVCGFMILMVGAFMTLPVQGGYALAQDAGIEFFNGIQDVPVMPGLIQMPDQAMVYDKAQGRIVMEFARLEDISQAQVRSYYTKVLPQFGWVRNGDDKYRRGSEELAITFEEEMFLKLVLQPAQ